MCPFLLSISHSVPFTKRLQPFSLLFRPSNSDYLCSQPLSTPNSKLFPMMRHLHLSSLLGSSSSSFGGSSRSEGESDGEEDMDDERGEVGTDECGAPERWSVLGIGQAMVDFSGIVDDGFLDRLGLEKGTRKVVNHEERGRVLQAMDGCNYKAAAGGSLSNSLVALARLGAQPVAGRVLHVAMAGSVGSDPLGGFFWARLQPSLMIRVWRVQLRRPIYLLLKAIYSNFPTQSKLLQKLAKTPVGVGLWLLSPHQMFRASRNIMMIFELHNYGGELMETDERDYSSAPSHGVTAANSTTVVHPSAPHADIYQIGAPRIFSRVAVPKSLENWIGPTKISKIYSDWIDDE